MDRAKNKVNNKVNQKIDQKMDKTIDKGVDGAENATKKNSTSTTDAEPQTATSKTAGNKAFSTNTGFKSYSKFDFVPGEKLIAAEDFSQDAIGDFPARWNTNGGGEIVTTNNKDGRFLLTKKKPAR